MTLHAVINIKGQDLKCIWIFKQGSKYYYITFLNDGILHQRTDIEIIERWQDSGDDVEVFYL